jgi:hypothetical protein
MHIVHNISGKILRKHSSGPKLFLAASTVMVFTMQLHAWGPHEGHSEPLEHFTYICCREAGAAPAAPASVSGQGLPYALLEPPPAAPHLQQPLKQGVGHPRQLSSEPPPVRLRLQKST